eukprot:CAMPEP_0115055516 /NCGR_PEP_ID=MMETSP0227-20121206/4692_1 /TAXON_ID=89957 /ORGANISM="Polarella glacialis, Strain CCMP 1383" /LENGTH=591 /DNA_ID=CAMNT_0002440109 /DNA_START=75 /DNA_END=1850 /DNA_ORIENTATION=+
MTARSVQAQHLGGEVFVCKQESSAHSVLWGALYKEKERSLLRTHMEEGEASFSIQDTFQIAYRVIWQYAHKKEARLHHNGRISGGKLAVLLHGYSKRAVNSWAWSKIVRHLYKKGFTVVMVDMPGFGRSSMNMKWNCPVMSWMGDDWRIVSKVIEHLGFTRCVHFVGYRESCATWKNMPHMVNKGNILLDPIFALDDVMYIAPPIWGADKAFMHLKASRQREMMDKVLNKSGATPWCLFTPSARGETQEARAVLGQLQQKRALAFGKNSVIVTDLSAELLSEAQVGAQIAEFIVFPCRYLRQQFADILAGDGEAPLKIPDWALDVASTVATTALTTALATPAVDGDEEGDEYDEVQLARLRVLCQFSRERLELRSRERADATMKGAAELLFRESNGWSRDPGKQLKSVPELEAEEQERNFPMLVSSRLQSKNQSAMMRARQEDSLQLPSLQGQQGRASSKVSFSGEMIADQSARMQQTGGFGSRGSKSMAPLSASNGFGARSEGSKSQGRLPSLDPVRSAQIRKQQKDEERLKDSRKEIQRPIWEPLNQCQTEAARGFSMLSFLRKASGQMAEDPNKQRQAILARSLKEKK